MSAAHATNAGHFVDTAISRILLSWNDDGSGTVEAYVLMDALTNLECARQEIAALLQQLEASAVIETRTAGDDDEPRAGDVAEAQRSEVDIKALVGALASKSRGASP